jgi:hypothetical protein
MRSTFPFLIRLKGDEQQRAAIEIKMELTAMRTDAVFEAMLDAVIHQQETMDLDPIDVPTVPRQRRPPRRITGPAPSHTSTSVSGYCRPIFSTC